MMAQRAPRSHEPEPLSISTVAVTDVPPVVLLAIWHIAGVPELMVGMLTIAPVSFDAAVTENVLPYCAELAVEVKLTVGVFGTATVVVSVKVGAAE